jgi:hypothetical protein
MLMRLRVKRDRYIINLNASRVFLYLHLCVLDSARTEYWFDSFKPNPCLPTKLLDAFCSNQTALHVEKSAAIVILGGGKCAY